MQIDIKLHYIYILIQQTKNTSNGPDPATVLYLLEEKKNYAWVASI